jgi:hypothetical protein
MGLSVVRDVLGVCPSLPKSMALYFSFRRTVVSFFVR